MFLDYEQKCVFPERPEILGVPQQGEAVFNKYDDGWRFERAQLR